VTKKWSYLPNATHIEWVLDTLKKNPKVWSTAWSTAWAAAWGDAWDAARAAAWDAARAAAWGDAWGDAWDAVCSARGDSWDTALEAARGASAALIAWDESSELLTMPITHVERLVKLEMPAAILLLPAVIVKHNLTNVRN